MKSKNHQHEKPYLKFVVGIFDGLESAKMLTVLGKNESVESSEKAVIFSPHPDDECITGLLALRFMREAGMQVINVPVTYGSNEDRKSVRAEELNNACEYLGWSNYRGSGGAAQCSYRALEKADIVAILTKLQPCVIFVPHGEDWNTTHIFTNHMVFEALAEMPEGFGCLVVETEYWGAMRDPNLMVEADTETLADLVAATSFHTGEITRNPYHLLLPAWMQDNVRRGAELIGGKGCAAPDFSFATLYRLSRWQNNALRPCLATGRMLARFDCPREIL